MKNLGQDSWCPGQLSRPKRKLEALIRIRGINA
jgi:hypothetical protein